MNIMNLVNLVLYWVFGFMLTKAGVSVTEKPFEFFTLLGILMLVDIVSHVIARR